MPLFTSQVKTQVPNQAQSQNYEVPSQLLNLVWYGLCQFVCVQVFQPLVFPNAFGLFNFLLILLDSGFPTCPLRICLPFILISLLYTSLPWSSVSLCALTFLNQLSELHQLYLLGLLLGPTACTLCYPA